VDHDGNHDHGDSDRRHADEDGPTQAKAVVDDVAKSRPRFWTTTSAADADQTETSRKSGRCIRPNSHPMPSAMANRLIWPAAIDIELSNSHHQIRLHSASSVRFHLSA
jgi:hypothetical protein